jgi:hypothetical protein
MTNKSLRYLDICLNELNIPHQFYFDANDVIDILNGVHIFYESKSGKEFQKYHFDNENRVIQALAYGGFLGKNINLLPPHQSELADNIKKGLFEPIAQYNYLDFFWKNDLNYYSYFEDIINNTYNKFPSKEIEEWVKFKGKDFFKAIFFSYKTSWQERLVEIFEKEYFQINDYNVDDIEIYDQQLFNTLLDAFSHKGSRSNKSENNYRDVISLMYLSRKVKQYNKGKIEQIPVFFDSQNFISIIPHSILKEYFSIKKGNSKYNSANYALRDADYFKLYSLLAYNQNYPNEDKNYENFVNKQHIIIELKQMMNEIEINDNFFGSRSKLENNKNKLEEKISNYIDYDFFNTILLKFISEDNEVIKKVYSDIRIPPIKDEIINIIKEKVQLILSNLNKEINEITNWSANIYTTIDKRIEHLREITDKQSSKSQPFEVFNDYSLFRFFIPQEYRIEIKLLFSSDGLLSKEVKTFRGALISIWNLIFTYSATNKNIKEKDLFKIFSSLWILSLHDKIYEIKIKDNSLHHSLLMLKGACLDRSITEHKRENFNTENLVLNYLEIIKILDDRCLQIKTNKEFDFKYCEIKISLAYLYFHLWLQKGNQLILESNDYINSDTPVNIENILAIDAAHEALTIFDKISPAENQHRIYALNIYCYYIIDSASNEVFEKNSYKINELITLKSRINDWHFRYDDTIARNFHRRALLVNSVSSKLYYIKTALNILEESLSKVEELDGRDIKEVISYKLRLQNYYGEIEYINQQTAY